MLNDFFQSLSALRHRGVIVLSGSRQWSTSALERYLPFSGELSILWLASSAPACDNVRHYQHRNITQYLGSECSILVFDAHDGFSPNAFCAAADTLVGGGIIFLLLPDVSAWQCLSDADFTAAYATQKSPLRFIQRVSNAIGQADAEGRFLRIIRESVDDHLLQEINSIESPVVGAYINSSVQQAAVADAIFTAINGRAHRPLLVRAARGRGKSAALGIALARWLQLEVNARIVVTGPSRSAVATALTWAEKHTGISMSDNTLIREKSELVYLPVDQVIEQLPEAVAIVIDEAAAIPMQVLQKLLQHYSRAVFITTTIGYEGSGRGFDLRFTKFLDEQFPQWRRAGLFEPVRWAADDSLEKWLQQCFLLADCAISVDISSNVWSSVATDSVVHREVLRDELAFDESLLSDIFRLLVEAHYRTEPDDLRFLLDAPDVRLFVTFSAGKVVAVALVVEEKPLSDKSVERIKTEPHRPRGHLFVQTLALQQGFYSALSLHGWRIVRIAVQPELQRQCIGKTLLSAVVNFAEQAKIDFIGSSFALDAGVLQFWQTAGFSLLRIGLHRDHTSGSFAGLVMLPLSTLATDLNEEIQQRFSQQLPHLLTHYYQYLEPELLIVAYSRLPCFLTISESDRQQVDDYLRSAIAYDAAWYSLSKMLQFCLYNSDRHPHSCRPAILPVKCILQRLSWGQLAKAGNFSGRKAIEAALRENLREIFSEFF